MSQSVRQTRLCKWPVVTLYPFIARPDEHFLVKPSLMKRTAATRHVQGFVWVTHSDEYADWPWD